MAKAHIIRAVVFRGRNAWVAQCLDHDIATQADTLDTLLYELERIVVAHLIVADTDGLSDPFAGIPKAPHRFWEASRAPHPGINVLSVHTFRLGGPGGAPPVGVGL